MLKRDELSDSNSCLNKAKDDERLFVLLGRDPAAPAAIQAWVDERIRLGKNQPGDAQIREAEQCAMAMEAESRARTVEAKRCKPQVVIEDGTGAHRFQDGSVVWPSRIVEGKWCADWADEVPLSSESGDRSYFASKEEAIAALSESGEGPAGAK